MLIESFSGIRGLYNSELTPEIAQKYAHSYYTEFLSKNSNQIPKIAIGRDSRESGDEILQAMLKSLNCEILDLGVSPTPIIENAVRTFQCDGGIIITASHNEPEYNGFKFLGKDGGVLNPQEIEKVIEKFKTLHLPTDPYQNPSPPQSQNPPSHQNPSSKNPPSHTNNLNTNTTNQTIENYHDSALGSYIGFVRDILGETTSLEGIKVLIDPNGGAGILAQKVFEEFNVQAEYINTNKGEFNRLVEPNLNSLSYLKEKLNNTEFAAGFDCDADRVEILLNNGELVAGNEILAIIADDILTNSNNQFLIANDATSYLVKEISEKHNCNYIEVEVGETNVVNKMHEHKSIIGGEGSNGGIIIQNSKCRDGILGTLYLIKILLNKNKTLKELINDLPKYHYLKEKITLNNNQGPLKIREQLKTHYKKQDFTIKETGDQTGGLKFLKDNSWIWFRQSKTENNVLRIITDSKSKPTAEELMEEAKSLLISELK